MLRLVVIGIFIFLSSARGALQNREHRWHEDAPLYAFIGQEEKRAASETRSRLIALWNITTEGDIAQEVDFMEKGRMRVCPGCVPSRSFCDPLEFYKHIALHNIFDFYQREGIVILACRECQGVECYDVEEASVHIAIDHEKRILCERCGHTYENEEIFKMHSSVCALESKLCKELDSDGD